MLFTRREVRIGKNVPEDLDTARGLHKTEGTVFSQYGPTLAGE